MLITGLFWVIAALAVILLVASLYNAMKRREKGSGSDEETSPIYVSGVYSLIRKSPRQDVEARSPSAEKIAEELAKPTAMGIANGTSAEYQNEWQRIANLCINIIEKGDRDGVQTYRYQVPEKCQKTCARYGGDAYVTREQLHNHCQLIPPFHLGCGVQIVTKEAWSASTEGAGWTPILPVNGEYPTLDWRTLVKL
jgi:hypothetical protein